jgi:hydrogenase maturation protease
MNCGGDENPVLVIGCGNPLRGDDGLGSRAAELLRQAPPPDTHIITCHQLLPEMAETLSQASLVILIDASVQGPAGTIHCQTVAAPPPASHAPRGPELLAHHLELTSLLHWAQTLFGHAPRAVALSIGAAHFDFGEELSAPVAASLPGLLERVRQIIAEHAVTPPPLLLGEGGGEGGLNEHSGYGPHPTLSLGARVSASQPVPNVRLSCSS